MASLSHYLTSLLFFSFLYTSINDGATLKSPDTECAPFDCGNGMSLRYPFWLQSQQFQHCGYPGFNLSCDNKNPTINLSSDKFCRITGIDYSSKSLSVSYTKLSSSNCPIVPTSLGLVSSGSSNTPSLFNYTLGNKILHFFYNCSLYPPSLSHITCLEFNAMRSYVFVEGSIPEFDWQRYCESSVTVPVMDEAVGGGSNLVETFGDALKGGFKLAWMQPAGACQTCELSSGLCGYGYGMKSNFSCICSNGIQSSTCNEHTDTAGGVVVQARAEQNYVAAIGGVIFGGLVIAATVLYFIRRKKVGSYKPV